MQNIGTKEKENRKIYLDLIKLLAIFLVLFNHTGTSGYVIFLTSRNSCFYWPYMISSVLTKMNVPLFLMISGALLLKKEESIKTILKKRFLKYLVLLIVCSFLSYLYTCFKLKYLEFSFDYFIRTIYAYEINTSYWYLYIYMAYILMLPFLRRLAKSMTNKEYMWMIATFAFMEILSVVEFFIWKGTVKHNVSFSLFNELQYVFYPLLGYFIDERLTKESFSKKTFFILIILSIAVICSCCILTNYRCKVLNQWNEENSQQFLNVLRFIPTITVFYGIKWMLNKHPLSTNKARVITTASSTVLGIYLFEQIFRYETINVYLKLSPYIGSWFATIIWTISACILGGITTLLFNSFINLLKQIKGKISYEKKV